MIRLCGYGLAASLAIAIAALVYQTFMRSTEPSAQNVRNESTVNKQFEALTSAQDPYQPETVRTVPEVLPDPSRHSSADRGSCVLPGDVRGVVWLAVYRDCSSLNVALVHDPVPHGNIGPDRPAKSVVLAERQIRALGLRRAFHFAAGAKLTARLARCAIPASAGLGGSPSFIFSVHTPAWAGTAQRAEKPDVRPTK
jgi:hypothetical protein